MNTSGLLAVIGCGVLTLAVLFVGARLLLLAARNRQSPELLVGLAFVLCGLGYALATLPQVPGVVPEGARIPILTVGRFAFALGSGSAGVATWRIFRPSGFVSLAFMYSLSMMLGAGFVNDLLAPEPESYRTSRLLYWMGFAAAGLCFGWSAFESLRYYRLLRRRIRYGLADPLVARGILLWGVAASSIAATFPIAAAERLVSGGLPYANWVHGVIACQAVVASACIWRAFFGIPRRKALVRSREARRPG